MSLRSGRMLRTPPPEPLNVSARQPLPDPDDDSPWPAPGDPLPPNNDFDDEESQGSPPQPAQDDGGVPPNPAIRARGGRGPYPPAGPFWGDQANRRSAPGPTWDQMRELLEAVRPNYREPHVVHVRPEPAAPPRGLTVPQMNDLIPNYDGRGAPEPFINACNLVAGIIGPEDAGNFMNILRIKLTDRAYYLCERVGFVSWTACKEALRGAFQTHLSSTEIRAKMTSMSQGNDAARDFGERVEKQLISLNRTIIREFNNPHREVVEAMTQLHENLAINTFEDGLRNEELRVMVRVSAKTTLADAVTIAARHEVRIKAARPSAPTRSDRLPNPAQPFRPIRPERQTAPGYGQVTCYKCGAQGHYANACVKQEARSPVANERAALTAYRPPQNPGIVCRYCQASGHRIEACTLRAENNARRGISDGTSGGSQPRPPVGQNPSEQGRRPNPFRSVNTTNQPSTAYPVMGDGPGLDTVGIGETPFAGAWNSGTPVLENPRNGTSGESAESSQGNYYARDLRGKGGSRA